MLFDFDLLVPVQLSAPPTHRRLLSDAPLLVAACPLPCPSSARRRSFLKDAAAAMPHQPEPLGVGALDEDLLAALDDVLSLSEHTSVSDAFAATDSATLGDEIDAMLSVEIPPLRAPALEAHKEPAEASSLHRSGSGQKQQTPSVPGKKGKDVRAVPYAKATNPRRRKRPKDELDYLRAKVADMEDELAALKAPEVGSPAAVSADVIFKGDAGVGLESSLDVLLCWKKIAERQKKEADRSVVENLRLRAMLEGQLNVARSLEVAIDQHQRDAAQSLPALEHDGALPQPTAMSDELIFALLNESLEAQYAELDAVFELSGIAHINYDMNNGTKAHHDANGVAVRHEEVRLLPFSMEAVHRAMWGILRYSTAKEMMLGPFQTQVIDDNRMNVTMVEKIELSKSRVTTIVRRFSFRRVFEKNRSAVVWSSYIEMDGSVFVRLREKGYCTSSPFNFGGDDATLGVPGSVTRMAVHASPEMTAFASPEEQKAHIGEITELVVGTYRVSMGLMHQIIDTLLLREAMGGKTSGGGATSSVGSPTVASSPL
ncbi:hypothetical protein PHYPSEUDO_003457 [Phytophthora pseudosyringae]|uniref:M96 mating-specific protein family n=1 Tax=Phytophthora pseudosyringae TaxID=221518 RepID=A0A8T1VUH4_9STRA|nr:hypothetical protein PHYPSEUDO_003457 [Phytophthora pseudosyringae]